MPRRIVQLMRPGGLRSVNCESLPAQEPRTVVAARRLAEITRPDVEMGVRGILRVKAGHTTPRSLKGRVRDLVCGQAMLEKVADGVLIARASLRAEAELSESLGYPRPPLCDSHCLAGLAAGGHVEYFAG
jgi:hypothetical protein